jgi:LPS export ABC transporter protein LptC
MNWRWISIAALLAALVIAYDALTGRGSSQITSAQPPPQPGYYLTDAVVTSTQADGSLSMQLIAERIEQQPKDDTITLLTVRAQYYRTPQQQWALSADRGFVPADSRVVHLEGDVELRPVDSDTASFLRADSLAIDTEKSIAYSTSSPVRMSFGPHTMTVRSFRADLNSENIRLESVNGRFQPQ